MQTIQASFVAALVPAIAILLAGCATQPATPTDLAATPVTVATSAPAGRPGIEAPPDAGLNVEGGDPVTGQLGTFVWGGGGSDSPWLPGAPIGAAAGETLSVTLAPNAAISGWSARLAPASATGGQGAIQVGTGPAAMDVTAPGAGSWTLAVTIAFGDLGSATYFWLLEIP